MRITLGALKDMWVELNMFDLKFKFYPLEILKMSSSGSLSLEVSLADIVI